MWYVHLARYYLPDKIRKFVGLYLSLSQARRENAYGILVGKTGGRNLLEKLKVDAIMKMGFKETGWDRVNWINLA